MKKIIIIFFAALLFSCVQTEEEKIVAQVNDVKLTFDEFKANFSNNKWEALTIEDKKEFIQDWVQLTLLSQEADLLEISQSPKLKEKIKSAEINIKANALIATKLADVSVSEDELFNYYKIHKSEYQTSHKEFKVQRIFTKDRAKLNTILDAIKTTSFKNAAILHSEEAAGKNGGYIGFLSKKNIHINIWNTLTSLQKHYYKTVETDRGFYLVKYYDTRTVYTDKTFLEVKEEIVLKVTKRKKEDLFENLIKELKNKSEIIISI
ncbi:MAG: peptidyl-prolyl cis-trans isomerase [Candidatus Cloacimonetes bacterium]|jgi:parvulin-like peptidyl-prolyl isomerase|nr:peptidyl-prolyl cis-trans isomerase [Candidatus Cloacimonadota bacterium]MBT4574991.1 peptidyl-prolyl cis-trans isomerase [Candidatus Cloacimonadota bacterium]